jgi:hypothetical protein
MLEFASSSTAHGYYVWESGDQSLTVLLNLQVLDRLKQSATPDEEIGGFLIGISEDTEPGKVRITIADFELVESSQQRGPHYHLNERDRKRFARRLSRPLSSIDPKLRPIGFFRTHLRSDLYLATSDIGLMQSDFPGPTAVAMVVRLAPDPMAGFFSRKGGELQPQPRVTFPFDREQLEQGEFKILKPPARRPVSWTKPRPTRSAWALRWWWAAGGVIVVALAALGFYGMRSELPETMSGSASMAGVTAEPVRRVAEAPPPVQPGTAAAGTNPIGSADRSIMSATSQADLQPARKSRVKVKGKRARRIGKRRNRSE